MTLLTAPTSSDHARRVEELGRIIMAYSEVTEKLQRSHEQLTETVRRLQDELGEKNRLLERSNRLAALGEMAAGMAHEIRNPLGAIQLYASVLEKDLAAAGGRDDCVQVVRKISGGVKRLEGLVGQVLSFTREMRAQCCPIDLAEVVEQAADDAADAMRRRGVRCVIDGPRPMPVRADPLLLGQAVLNLLLNATQAIDESGRGGTVTLIYMPPPPDSGARQFHLVVRDDGPGIPPEVMERIFNPFFTTRDEGTGLGLAMVHRVVEAHDGTITAANTDGGGARFEIRV